MRLERQERTARDPNLIMNPFRDLTPTILLIDTREDVPEDLRKRNISRDEAARLKEDTGFDLYVVGRTESDAPMVVKLLDYGKFRYEQQKSQKETARKQRESAREIKDFYFSPLTGQHDIDTKVKQIASLLTDHDIRIGVKLNGTNRATLTHRRTVPLDRAVRDPKFVLNRVIDQLGTAATSMGVQIGERTILAMLKPR